MAEVEFYGESFRIEDEPNEFALMQFMAAAEDAEVNSSAAMAAAFRLLQAAVVPDDWSRFKQTAFANKATSETLMPVMFAVFEQATGRPTERPSVSTDGHEPTQETSESQPDAEVTDLLSGRPDMAFAFEGSRRSLKAVSA